MALSHSNPKFFQFWFVTLIALVSATQFVSGNFYGLIDPIWGQDHMQYQDGGNILGLSLDRTSGSGFQSKFEYLFGKITMAIKLVSGNSAGTVATFYIASPGENHDEVDFEFLGNQSGSPYTLHTNLFAQGKGEKEQRFFLWFDPTADYHNYTFLWNPYQIAFLVDDIPIRVFRNHMAAGIPFPHDQPMRVHCSLWDAEAWATQGGLVKTDWSLVPFIAYYKDFIADACIPEYAPNNNCDWGSSWTSWYNEQLDVSQQYDLKWVKDNYMIYNYCTDYERTFPDGYPPECLLS
ncbi:hypothetical protein LUZ60_008926 [Juncus effusus]|nr:hypothetical protein LUZ60_008926 [Juncus effusus]